MKRTAHAFAAVLLLVGTSSVSGCSTFAHVFGGGSVADTAPATMATAEKDLTVIHLAYNGLGQIILTNTASGLLHGPTAATVKTYYDKAGDVIAVADKADSAANAQGIEDALVQARDLIAQAKGLAQ